MTDVAVEARVPLVGPDGVTACRLVFGPARADGSHTSALDVTILVGDAEQALTVRGIDGMQVLTLAIEWSTCALLDAAAERGADLELDDAARSFLGRLFAERAIAGAALFQLVGLKRTLWPLARSLGVDEALLDQVDEHLDAIAAGAWMGGGREIRRTLRELRAAKARERQAP